MYEVESFLYVSRVGPFIGLFLIALGTGGIKPCVSAFGADQISMTNVRWRKSLELTSHSFLFLFLQPKQLNRYFAFFYFAINTGSLVSTLLTPLLRSTPKEIRFYCLWHFSLWLGKFSCFGYDCYSLAFGIPALLMLISISNFVVTVSLPIPLLFSHIYSGHATV